MRLSRFLARPVTKAFFFLLLIAGVDISIAAPAVISGQFNGVVTEDNDPDADNLLEVSAKLSVTDADTGEASFSPSVKKGRYGNLYINARGNWYYAVRNDLAVIQNLSDGQSLKDTISVNSFDGTRRSVTITIRGVDEQTGIVNTPAVISGVDSGNVTKNADPDGDRLLETNGRLTIVDPDAGEGFFRPSVHAGSYGALYINAGGNWFYAVQNDLVAIQDLNAAQSLTDSIAVSSIDGTKHTVAITIKGAGQSGVISLNWNAPVAREDGSSISMAEIAGYRVYYGVSQGDYVNEVAINNSSTMSVTLSNLASGTYYFVITAVDSDGRESAFSREVIKNL